MNHLKTYPAHLLLYIVAAVDLVAQTPAVGGLAPYAPWITAAGALSAAIHHSYQSGASTVVKSVAPALLAALLTGTLLSGCAVLQKINTAVTSPQAQPYIKAGALVAVATAEQHGVSAAEINAVAKKALAADQGVGASLAAVQAVLDAELIKLHLPAGDLMAIMIVEAEFNAYIQAQIGNDPTLAGAQAAAADIFQAVIAATGG